MFVVEGHPGFVSRSADLEALFPGKTVAYQMEGGAQDVPLYEEEAACIPSAREKRRSEFASGRLCARNAMAEFGVHDFAVLVGSKREPLWPDTLVGSITHAAGFCGAVLASTGQYRGIGVDVEALGRLDQEMERMICTDAEMEWLRGQDPAWRSQAATLIFSAKEAFYKCQFCLTGAWLGFRDVCVELKTGQFEVRLLDPRMAPALPKARFLGNFSMTDKHVQTGIAIE